MKTKMKKSDVAVVMMARGTSGGWIGDYRCYALLSNIDKFCSGWACSIAGAWGFRGWPSIPWGVRNRKIRDHEW